MGIWGHTTVLSQVLWGLAASRHFIDPGLLDMMCAGTMRTVLELGAEDLGDLAWAVAMLGGAVWGRGNSTLLGGSASMESDEESESMEEDMEDFEYLGDGNWGRAESDSDESSSDEDDTEPSDVDEHCEDGDSEKDKKDE